MDIIDGLRDEAARLMRQPDDLLHAGVGITWDKKKDANAVVQAILCSFFSAPCYAQSVLYSARGLLIPGPLRSSCLQFMRKISPIRVLTVLFPTCSKDGSAWRDGQIKVGDQVVAVDSKSVIGWSHDDLVNAIAGRLRRVHCHLP
jgi:hypothetical protein